MSKTVDQAIQELQAEIAADESAIRKKKETVNTLCAVNGLQAAYNSIASEETVVTGPIRPDQFYGQPLAGAVRVILEMRKAANLGAATVNEIYDALKAGGFKFDTKTEDIARKSLRNSLVKNILVFHKLPNGTIGLTSWYPKAKNHKSNNSDENEESDDADASTDKKSEAA